MTLWHKNYKIMKYRQSCTLNNKFWLQKGLALFFLVVLALSCEKERDLRAYYFPMKELKRGLVYEYQSVGPDSFPPAYWYYRSFINGDSVFLTGTKYNGRILPEQFVREEMVGNGMLTVENFIYENDSFGRQLQLPVQIIAGDVFPFFVKEEGGVFVHQTRWDSKMADGTSFEITKNRKFIGDTTYTVLDKELPAIKFQVREALDQKRDGTLTLESIGEEIYAQGVGLVAFKKRFDNGLNLSFELRLRYGMDILEYKYLDLYGDPDEMLKHFDFHDHAKEALNTADTHEDHEGHDHDEHDHDDHDHDDHSHDKKKKTGHN